MRLEWNSVTFVRVPGVVSIVIPNYNCAAYLYDCLEGIRNQTYNNWEIILVDDGSTDHSVQQAERWLQSNRATFPRDNTFITLVLPRNVGYSGAATIGLYMAWGEYIAFQDADDISHRERFEKQVHYLNNHPKIEMLGTNYHVFEGNPKVITAKPKWIHYGEQIRNIYYKGGHCVCHGTIMLRGTLFDRIGGHTRRVEGAEDYDFIARCLHPKELNVDNLSDVLYYYRSHPNQRSRKFFNKRGIRDEK